MWSLRLSGRYMFKLVGHKSSKFNLLRVVGYINDNPNDQFRFEQFIAMMLRSQFKSYEKLVPGDVSGIERVRTFLYLNSISIPDEIAKEMAHQCLSTSQNMEKSMGPNAGSFAQLFLSGYYRMISQAPDRRVAEKNKSFQKPNKDEMLLRSFEGLILKLFNEKSEMLTSDDILELAENTLGY